MANLSKKTRVFWFHLFPSLLLLAASTALIVFAWYPYPLLQASGTGKFSLLLMAVTCIAAPALTWLVHTPGKSRRALIFDLVVIGLIQLTAVAWSMYNLSLHKPHFMVFAVDRFEVLARGEVTYPVTDPAFLDKPLVGPILLYANMPTDPAAYQKLLREVMFEGKPDLPFRPRFWSAYKERRHLALQAARPLLDLREDRPEASDRIDGLVSRNGTDIQQLKFIPTLIGDGHFATVINGGSGDLVGYLNIDPWLD